MMARARLNKDEAQPSRSNLLPANRVGMDPKRVTTSYGGH